MAKVTSAQKTEDRNFSWVEFTPPYHSHLVKCAVALVPHPVHVVKRVMFVYILELLNGEGHMAFFDLQKGGHKANNVQKEKTCLAQKRCCAAKHEQDHEAAKLLNSLPLRGNVRPVDASSPPTKPPASTSTPSPKGRV